jgi:hypothetical protein
MRVFVLNTGRCGSKTFSAACRHITNYSSGHETLGARHYGPERFEYPDQHIEVDNRLSWFLGTLDRLFGLDDVLWVHLIRDSEATARSFYGRWNYLNRLGIIEAFGHAMIMSSAGWSTKERMSICRFYVETVTANIELFLRGRPNQMEFHLESAKSDFTRFWEMIGAEGDLAAGLTEWDRRYNATHR